MKSIIFFLITGLLLLTSCSDSSPLSGKLQLESGGRWAPTIYLIDPGGFDGIARSYMGQLVDSATVKEDGSFTFASMPDVSEARVFQLAIQQKGERFLNKLDNEDPGKANYFPFVWQNDQQLVITADADQFQRTLTIQDPSPENKAMQELRNIRQQAFTQFLAGTSADAHDEAKLLAAEKALLSYQQALMQFAEETPFLLPALTAIRWMSIEANYERIPEFMVAQCERWQAERPDHAWVAQLCQYGDRAVLPVLKGDDIPDFALPMLSGDTLTLQHLLGERLTILDLWASWCAPCRKENRNYLVPLWEEYQEEGFQIVAYALDASPRVWRGAIELDGADRWLHASHLRGDDAPLLETLRISTIPANFLIDGRGKVVAKNLHGQALVDFVEDFLKK